MELSRSKRLILGISFLAIVVGCFISGFLLARVRPSKINYSNELDEVVSYLNKYYYKDIDMEEFEKKYVEGGVNSLNDPYTYIYYKETSTTGDYTGFGFGVSKTSMGLEVGKVYKESPAYSVGIRRGDYVVGVDDLHISKNTLDELSNYLSSANSEITLHLVRNYKPFDLKITKGTVKADPLVESKMIGTIGYIKINEFDSGVAKEFSGKLTILEESGITGLIIDVRNNPGGYANEVVPILQLFLTGNDAFLYLDSKDSDTPEIYRPKANNVKKSYDIKILMNEKSASASEVFALAMNRVMNYDLIGTTSFGKGVFQNDIKLKTVENGYLHVTCGYWYGPKRECIDKKGIEPTIELKENIYSPFVFDNNTYSLDDCNNDIKDVENMLKIMGNETRIDGYFDSNLESLLITKYSNNKLTYEIKKSIFDGYNKYLEDYNNDIMINKALDLLK